MEDRLRQGLLDWYAAHARDLPWRRPPHAGDPYAILVSECMSQQTRLSVVVPFFERWMRRFPTPAILAAATPADVMSAWAGLGYYRRARSLHAAASHLVRGIPANAAAWQEIPGVGPYTAAAVASIAQGERVACVDGNVERVLARFTAERRPVAGAVRRALHRQAAQLLPEWAPPGDWNQAMMELGATVCTPQQPKCGQCPLGPACAGRAVQDGIPAARSRPPPRKERRTFLHVTRGPETLLQQTKEGLLAGLWNLPEAEAALPLGYAPGPHVATLTHKFTHRTWEMLLHAGVRADDVAPGASAHRPRVRPAPPSALPQGFTWATPAALQSLPLSAAARKLLAAAPNSRHPSLKPEARRRVGPALPVLLLLVACLAQIPSAAALDAVVLIHHSADQVDPFGIPYGQGDTYSDRYGHLVADVGRFDFPHFVADGVVPVRGIPDPLAPFASTLAAYANATQDRLAVATPVALGVDARIAGGFLAGRVQASGIPHETGAQTLHLLLAVSEDRIHFQPPAAVSNGVVQHRFTVRSLTDLGAIPAASNFTVPFSVPAGAWDMANVAIAAWVQADAATGRFEPHEVLQAVQATAGADGRWHAAQQTKAALLELYSATWCGPCLYGDLAVERIAIAQGGATPLAPPSTSYARALGPAGWLGLALGAAAAAAPWRRKAKP